MLLKNWTRKVGYIIPVYNHTTFEFSSTSDLHDFVERPMEVNQKKPAFSYIGFNNEDALIRPKVTRSFDDGFDILGGANIFIGNRGRFGQYDSNDMVYLKIKYSF